ncbi:MAG: TetR/AcrR family transcriptional regulator [Clostridia bacterium]|nr:TetR/AcrR family transcriptional regulator [Clostridia bacterium]
MGKKSSNLTKKRIVSAAWKLFYEQGYENTTIDEIVEESCTSRGSFYHYFDSKDALLSSLSYVFDEKYEEIAENLDWNQNCFDILIQINRELFDMIENTISIDLLAQLYSSQLITSGEKHLLDHNRVYYKFLRKIVIEGQKRDELTKEESVNDIVKEYALLERALLYDWCLCNGEYSLKNYSQKMMPLLLNHLKK